MFDKLKNISEKFGFMPSDPLGNILENAFDAEIDTLIITDTHGQIKRFNQTAQDLFPHINDGMQIKTILRAPALQEAFDALSKAQHNKITVDFTLKVPNEHHFHTIIITNAHHYYIRLQDITEQKRAFKMHGDFVANVSHELRTPLASICGFIETLQGPAKDDPDATHQFLGIMDGQAKRMKALVDGLLSLSRIELNRHITPTDKIELSSIMADTAIAMVPIAQTKNITITYDNPNNKNYYALGNRDEIFQVMQNLTENAIKYSDPDTHINLMITDKEQNWALSVQDQGRGIDAHHIARLSERFYRVDDARHRSEGGAGLGLSIVASILARHNAYLDIQSGIDKGSTFSAVLPKQSDT